MRVTPPPLCAHTFALPTAAATYICLGRRERGHHRKTPVPRPDNDEACGEHRRWGQLLPVRTDGQGSQRPR